MFRFKILSQQEIKLEVIISNAAGSSFARKTVLQMCVSSKVPGKCFLKEKC